MSTSLFEVEPIAGAKRELSDSAFLKPPVRRQQKRRPKRKNLPKGLQKPKAESNDTKETTEVVDQHPAKATVEHGLNNELVLQLANDADMESITPEEGRKICLEIVVDQAQNAEANAGTSSNVEEEQQCLEENTLNRLEYVSDNTPFTSPAKSEASTQSNESRLKQPGTFIKMTSISEFQDCDDEVYVSDHDNSDMDSEFFPDSEDEDRRSERSGSVQESAPVSNEAGDENAPEYRSESDDGRASVVSSQLREEESEKQDATITLPNKEYNTTEDSFGYQEDEEIMPTETNPTACDISSIDSDPLVKSLEANIAQKAHINDLADKIGGLSMSSSEKEGTSIQTPCQLEEIYTGRRSGSPIASSLGSYMNQSPYTDLSHSQYFDKKWVMPPNSSKRDQRSSLATMSTADEIMTGDTGRSKESKSRSGSGKSKVSTISLFCTLGKNLMVFIGSRDQSYQ